MMNRWLSVLRRLQWDRGLRAGLAVAGAMLVCRALGWGMGWAALGGFEAILVDNGGPYRSRLATMATFTVGGSVACLVGAFAGAGVMGSTAGNVLLAVVVTALFCFAATYARVASEWIASTSVIILVLYFAGYGGETHTFGRAAIAAGLFSLGCAWAAVLSLVVWPFDPFRPARREVAECYRVLAEFAAAMPIEAEGTGSAGELGASGEVSAAPVGLDRTSAFQRQMRLQLEAARRTLGATPARVTARTVRARNLAVLLETADMLFGITMRWRELAAISGTEEQGALRQTAEWLGAAERAVYAGLMQRLADGAASYLPEGSHTLDLIEPRLRLLAARAKDAEGGGVLARQLWADEREAIEDMQIAFEAVRSIWSGAELRGVARAGVPQELPQPDETDERASSANVALTWLDGLRANWTRSSVMMRHALRMGVVAAVDVVLMRFFRVQHGYWMAMTSIIVLQPYRSGTARKGAERVGGTIAGGVLAAVLAVLIHGKLGLVAAVTVLSTLTLATYAVDYAWYSFFLTPTFVLLSLPYARDWRFAGVRMETTVVGAVVAVLAMWLLWPEREHLELGRLLGLGAKADAATLRAVLRLWRGAGGPQQVAAARRLSGLAINDAEEALDRMLREPGLGRPTGAGDVHAEALTFVTYLRRLMRVATTLSVVGSGSESMMVRVECAAERLEALAARMIGEPVRVCSTPPERREDEDAAAEALEVQQMRRMERQVRVLERAAVTLGERMQAQV